MSCGMDVFDMQEALSLSVSLHAEWMFLVCKKHCVTSCGMDVFGLQETLCHFMQNGCFCPTGGIMSDVFYSAGGIMSPHAEWMF